MPINYGSLRSLTAREVVSALTRDGFVFDRGRGSQHIYGETFAPKALKSMIELEAKWTEKNLKRLKLLP